MVYKVDPTVKIIGHTVIDPEGLIEAMEILGAPEWDSEAPTDGEKLAEFYGRLCYKSFAPGLNPNIKKIREGNNIYLKNIIESKHGSVLEHISLNFVFLNVSRVFTHELVRHRVGTAISQESLRYKRLAELGFWLPPELMDYPQVVTRGMEILEILEEFQIWAAGEMGLDDESKFSVKKKLTSAMRRFAPIGLATNIGWSANIRTIRQVLEMRTDEGAETELRTVIGKLGELMLEKYPNFFFDFAPVEKDGLPFYKPENSKI